MLLGALAVLFFSTQTHQSIRPTDNFKYFQQAESTSTKQFWQAIVNNDFSPPAGKSIAELSRSLSALLGSSDPEMRDEIAYSTFAEWIYLKRTLSLEDLRPLIAEWLRNLSENIGSVGTDAVLRRSFSALVLSLVVARDNAAPFLEEKEFRTLLKDALAYADAEKDLRGYDPDKGWIHSAAHTADLLKHLGRSRYVTKADQAAILAAIGRKMGSASIVFTFGEDERLARAVLSIISRTDFDNQGFHDWLRAFSPVQPKSSRPQIEELRSYQNLKNLLAKLEVLLFSLPPDAPHAKDALASVQEALRGAF